MAPRSTTTRRTTDRLRVLSALAPLAFGGLASADTIVGDLTWAAGQPVSITEDLIIQGTLTIEDGVVVTIDAGHRIVVQNGGMLDVDGTEADPVVFQAAGGRWDGVSFEAGSMGDLSHAAIRATRGVAVTIADASPTFDHVEVSNVRAVGQELDAVGVLASGSAAPEFAWSRVFDIVGPTGDDGDGGSGGTSASHGGDGNVGHLDGYGGGPGGDGGDGGDGNDGGDAVGIRLVSGATATVSYSRFSDIVGGAGGQGGFGGSGSRGGNGGDGHAFVAVGNGGNGGTGGDGGPAGDGGQAGNAAAVWATDPAGQVKVYQNVFHDITGGNGGKGGRAGYGAQGGTGGNGADTDITFVCGGNGGNAGFNGLDSDGGDGGDAGWANAVVVENTTIRANVSQNTIANVTPGARGDRGDRVNNTTPSFGGNGGTGGWPNYCEGSDGTDRARPNNGVNGPYGAYADGAGMMASNGSATIQIQAVNNIFSMGTTVDAFAFKAGGSAIIASDSNLFDSATQEDFFTGSGTTSLGFAFVIGDPMFVDVNGDDFRLLAGSAAIDAGDSNNVVPLGLSVDMDGNPRIFDDPDTVNLGLFDPIDMGAYEFTTAAACPADIDNDGDADVDDISAFVNAFLANQADIDGDGDTDVDDISAFVDAFLVGCGG